MFKMHKWVYSLQTFRIDSSQTIEVAKLAVETGVWPLFEWDNETEKATLSRPSVKYRDKANRKPISEWTKMQGRFKGVSEELLKGLEADVDRIWNYLEKFL